MCIQVGNQNGNSSPQQFPSVRNEEVNADQGNNYTYNTVS